MKNITLEQPLFYNNIFLLRFEIGPAEAEIWTDFDNDRLNEEYFDIALTRSESIFDACFSPLDNISISYQIFSYGRQKIKKGNFIFKQINNIKDRDILFTKHRDIHLDTLEYKCQFWHRVTISNLKTQDINVKNLLKASVNTDFSRFRQPAIKGECFFINHSKGIVLLLYDDRGMDVVASEKESLLDLYKIHNDWILDYDRELIDRIFSEK